MIGHQRTREAERASMNAQLPRCCETWIAEQTRRRKATNHTRPPATRSQARASALCGSLRSDTPEQRVEASDGASEPRLA